MRVFPYLSAAAAVLSLVLVSPANAALKKPFTQEKVSVSGQLGYGVWLSDGDLNGYGFFLGASGGYTLPFNLYLGGRFDYHFGEGDEAPLLGIDVHTSSWLLQLEVGYDLGLMDMLVLRPKLGLGPMQGIVRACVEAFDERDCDSSSDTGFSMAIGAELPIELGPVYLSPETRFNFYFGEGEANGFLFGLHLGAVF